MNRARGIQAIGILGFVGGGILIWMAFQPDNLLCPHDRIIEACNPNFFYIAAGILVLVTSSGLAAYLYYYSPTEVRHGE